LTEAGMRRIFRTHRACAGAARVRPHRLRHTYGTELAAAGIDLLVLRDLMCRRSFESDQACLLKVTTPGDSPFEIRWL
jgi:integrase/recombinase XerC